MKGIGKLALPPLIEQRSALLSGRHVTYTLKRSGRRRSIGLSVDDRGLTISVPLRTSEKSLHNVLQQYAEWVVKKLDGWQARRPETPLWCDGEAVDYLGEVLMLRVVKSLFCSPLQRQGNELWLFVDDPERAGHIEQEVTNWYRKEALAMFEGRVRHYSRVLGVAPRAIKLTSAKTQWGSCTVAGVIRLNVQLVKLPVHLIDYVVVHELAHLRELNHSEAFWRLVESACPEYLRLRSELRDVAP
jgi:predicted metal-dependent hydrolase